MLSPRQLCQILIPVGFALAVFLFYLLTKQYVLGFEFDGSFHKSLLVTKVSTGQSYEMLSVNDEVVAIVTPEREFSLSGSLFPLSRTERRETFPSAEDYYSNQDAISNVLSEATHIKLANGQRILYQPKTLGPHEIPLSVVSSALCGLFAWLLTMLVWVWYPTKLPAICLMINGLGFYLMAISSALLSEGLAIFSFSFSLLLHYLFLAGHILFVIFGLCVLVYFPVALTRAELIKNIILLLGSGFLIVIVWSKWQPHLDWLDQKIWVSSYELYSFIGGGFLIAMVLCLLQWRATSANPDKRLHLYWVIVSWMVAPALYIALYMLPMAYDQTPVMPRPVTWLVMSFCYVLLLIVIWRFDLLYLNQHLKRATNWVFIISLLLMLDLLVLFSVHVNYDGPLLGVLAIVIWGYFPTRYFIKHLLYRNNDERDKSEYRNAISSLFMQSDYGLDGEPKIDVKWSEFLQLAFNPMSIYETKKSTDSRIMEQGQSLYVEANSYSPALLIRHAQRGSRLFSNEDLEMVNIMYFLYEQTSQFKSAFLAGQRQERQRIRRDLHDQIAFQLVSLIYSNNLNQSREIAKNTLSELRLLIKALQPNLTDLMSLQNELRKLAQGFCQVAELDLTWENTNSLPSFNISGRQYVNLMSVVKELLVNIQRHSKASKVIIKIVIEENRLHVVVHDNGVGLEQIDAICGNGMNNLRSRVEEIHGTITWSSNEGTLVSIYVPIETGIIGDQNEDAHC